MIEHPAVRFDRHRTVHDDAGLSCMRCGAYAEGDGLSYVECTGPETEHPPYLLADGTYETCAAHPYADCERAS